MQICKENQAANAEARMRAKNQYRPSTAMQGIFGDKKKIEEEYSLYDKPVDDDVDDGYLESIIEEDNEDEEDKDFRENLKGIDKIIQEKRNKLEETQREIQEITVNINQKMDVLEEEVEDFPNTTTAKPSEAIKEEEDQEEVNSEDEEDLAQYLEDQDDEDEEEETDEVYTKFEENQALVKLRDKIKMLRHRCEAGLGYTLFEKAYKLIKANSKNPDPKKLRGQLCELIGEDNIGFWVIFDNILFLEKCGLKYK